jgi:hypothetical protein
MEEELGIPTCLFGGPPSPGDLIKLGESQQGFMDVFARPLFESVSGVLPSMSFSIAELERNKQIWEQRIIDEKARIASDPPSGGTCDSSTSRGSYTESNPTNEKSTPHTSADGADLRSPSISSSNGQPTISAPSITATALPLQGIEEGFGANGITAGPRGRITGNGPGDDTEALTSQSDSRLLKKATGGNNEKQRAASVHHPTRKPLDTTEPLPNGLNPSFAASETDVRYLGNGGTVKSEKKGIYLSENGSEAQSQDRNGKRDKGLTQSFKRLFKKRWRPGATSQHKLEGPDRSANVPVNSSQGNG